MRAARLHLHSASLRFGVSTGGVHLINQEFLVMRIISGNLLNISAGIIVHQVNCKGVMGAGLAKSISTRWSEVFTRYHVFCKSGSFRPGMVQFIKVSQTLYVCNLAGQDGYGRDRQYTDYEALRIAMRKLSIVASERNIDIYLPFMMGCSLGGGDWSIVSRIIDEECPTAIVVKL